MAAAKHTEEEKVMWRKALAAICLITLITVSGPVAASPKSPNLFQATHLAIGQQVLREAKAVLAKMHSPLGKQLLSFSRQLAIVAPTVDKKSEASLAIMPVQPLLVGNIPLLVLVPGDEQLSVAWKRYMSIAPAVAYSPRRRIIFLNFQIPVTEKMRALMLTEQLREAQSGINPNDSDSFFTAQRNGMELMLQLGPLFYGGAWQRVLLKEVDRLRQAATEGKWQPGEDTALQGSYDPQLESVEGQAASAGECEIRERQIWILANFWIIDHDWQGEDKEGQKIVILKRIAEYMGVARPASSPAMTQFNIEAT